MTSTLSLQRILQKVYDPDNDALRLSGAGLCPAWTEYTPSLEATVTDPTLGASGGVTGWYRQIGTDVKGFARLVFAGAGANPGEGQYGITVPVPPKAFPGSGIELIRSVGTGYLTELETGFAAVNVTICAAALFDVSVVSVGVSDAHLTLLKTGDTVAGAVYVADDNPHVWGGGEDGDSILIDFSYEAAEAA